MRKKHFYILVGLALLISLLFVPQSLLEKTAYRIFRAPGKLGTIQEVIGRGEKTYPGGTQWISLKADDSVNEGDLFVTHGDSKILFAFNPPFWMMPYSKIEFLRRGEDIVGRLIYGEIKRLPPKEDSPEILITFEEKIIDSDSFSTSEGIEGGLLETALVPLSDASFKALSTSEQTPQGLTEKQIFQTLLLHKKFFQSCMIRLYKKENGLKSGQTVFDIVIQVNGVIEKTSVNKTDIQDQEYLTCLKRVFARVRFKNLQIKEPLHAVFPVNIETP
jgi:hypothetical protein